MLAFFGAIPMTKTKIERKVEPIKPANFQAAEHRFRSYDCTVANGTTKEDLENPELWVNVAPMLNKGVGFDHVRVMPEDESFIAYLIPTFSHGSDARVKLLNYYQLEPIDEMNGPQGKYDVKFMGQKKFAIYKVSTGEIIKDCIPTKAMAYKELEEHNNAMNS
jgi:hypothetical protein